jgi:hypothetical protein
MRRTCFAAGAANECLDTNRSTESAIICSVGCVGHRYRLALALLVFLCFGFAFRQGRTMGIGLAALCFAWSVEFSQLYHGPWIDRIRSTLVGHLALGSSFNRPDLIAYLVGVAFGAGAEFVFFNATRKA